MTHDQHIDADQLSREIDAETRHLRRLGHDTPAICAASVKIADRCRDRLRAGNGCADLDPAAFTASVAAAVAGFDGPDAARDRLVYALMAAQVPDDHGHDEAVECDLIHRGWLADRHGSLD
ncbi:hypothetical protein [uncultured Jannaschia sp.]|uniref:hypothetical protein n=1 Tax=uncultured Jannaschia sp. TaxID=293347 RepID=UPI002610BBD5|nr:hypothetical protein [uncultured Jannaschia sp.]